MTILFFFIISLTFFQSCQEYQTSFESFADYPTYNGTDLGVNYTQTNTTVKLWAPTSTTVLFRIYESGQGDDLIEKHFMNRKENGVWELNLDGDRAGKYYTFQSIVSDDTLQETPGPNAKAVGVNGKRGMIVDLATTNPKNWDNDKRPDLDGLENIIIYEIHVRDMTIHESSGSTNPGTFLGISKNGTVNQYGDQTGLDHLVELGVTHVHILPSFDFSSVDETKLDQPQYNWGYDPMNYNVPEGSYSTDPYNASVRIKEFKSMILAMHNNGIRVIMDVVYNHTGTTDLSVFNQTVPDYYYRHNQDNSWSDAAACGNETASERTMMRKYMIESVKYWANEYHIDGFRFDLMGIHDIETMNMISTELKSFDPTLFVYGEGWTAGNSPLPDSLRALKKYTSDLTDIAVFSDDLRDGLKGSVFEVEEKGFASGKPGLEASIQFGIVASTQHNEINYKLVNYSDAPWSPRPIQTINYVSCHDNNTLFDKLILSVPETDEEQIIKMHMLSQTIVLTSQGIPFLHAGTDFLRTKNGVENSYNYPDSINQINWDRKHEYREVFDYYRDLIALRKAHPAFRMPTTKMVQNHLFFESFDNNNLVGYIVKGNVNGDIWKNIYVLFNGNTESMSIDIPNGKWSVILEDFKIDENGSRIIDGGNYLIAGTSALILVQK